MNSLGGVPDSPNPVKNIFVFWGQSNMNGQGDADQLTGDYAKYAGAHSNIQIYGALTSGAFQNAEAGVNLRTTYAVGYDFGPELSFLYDVAEYLGETVYGIKYGYPSAPLKQGSEYVEWNVATADEAYNTLFYKADLSSYCQLAKAILEAQFPDYDIMFKAMMGGHGEQDASEQNADYDMDLTNLQTQARARLNADLISIYNKLHVDANYNQTWVDNIRADQQSVADADSDTYIIDIDDLELKPDSVHWTSDSTIIVGQRMAQAYINTL